MSLLVGMMLAASASGLITTSPTARTAASAAATPPVAAALQEGPCAAPRLACRHVNSFGMVISPTQAVTVQVDHEFDYTSGDSVLLMLGETATFKIDGAALQLVSTGRAADLPLQAAIDKVMGVAIPPGAALPSAPQPDLLRLSLVQATGLPDTFLFVENGFGEKVLEYKASVVSVNNVETPSPVCKAKGGQLSYAVWHTAVPTLHLSGFTLLDAVDDLCK